MLSDRLNVMDATAIVMCRENNLPLQVFNLFNAGDLLRIVQGEDVGTVVSVGPVRGEFMLDDIKKDATQRMQKCVSTFRDQLKKLRTGRAHTSLIEHIKVDYYGSEMPLNQVANIATEDAPDAHRDAVGKGHGPGRSRRRSIKSDLGLTPNTAGTSSASRCPP